jgi:hypothetical protein
LWRKPDILDCTSIPELASKLALRN